MTQGWLVWGSFRTAWELEFLKWVNALRKAYSIIVKLGVVSHLSFHHCPSCSNVKNLSTDPNSWVVLQDSIWSRKQPSLSSPIAPPQARENPELTLCCWKVHCSVSFCPSGWMIDVTWGYGSMMIPASAQSLIALDFFTHPLCRH